MENNCDDAAQGRDKEKFVQTVREHKGTIYTVCYMFSKDTDEVNDLYQEILMNLWRGFGSFEGKSDIRTWIYRVALNTCISIDRKKKRKPVRLNMDIDLYEDTDTDTRQVRMLYNRISRLGPFDRAIILLWLDNIPYEEIGEIVGISAKYVSVRLLRIKEELRKMK
ncbi:RNA polymerase sigma factor [Xylanibacter rodentium]|jgi:RNA polymerase sigma-70 factor (ECF subfamily)|uniref:Sigma-70 family RNA polymerase sigma factor n=1 Tax=Xylanibacter rodentium TaxID=2736289 RepID=A0ABX2ASV0_9BACT|nr:sigma-70 family RNA polymerase sigma factor [Xylanibacter rodentium]NPE11793.1 sigma-70 family RNA polymerase sigma factor [Prevotella sp. PJ1A]NPE13734.1 sigma-70 family RNA polymerase sigma factor [Xylanibacter rodentium]NPE38906.1 sigma-70 family RNA polymerase sigma factor [Prevotella sp. PCJ2]